MPLSDAEATELLGPKCPDCGWRRGWHNPSCPQYDDERRAPGLTDANVRAAADRQA